MTCSPSSEVVLNTDDAAAKLTTVTGWVSRDGLFYGKDERIARWAGCTHIVCECGKPTPKSYVKCDECRAKTDRERWLALPLAAPDWQYPLCIYQDDRYFWGEDELRDWCEDNDIKPSSLLLVTCEPHHWRQVDTDYWSDDGPEDWDGYLPREIEQALKALNDAIKSYRHPACWYPGKERVVIEDEA